MVHKGMIRGEGKQDRVSVTPEFIKAVQIAGEELKRELPPGLIEKPDQTYQRLTSRFLDVWGRTHNLSDSDRDRLFIPIFAILKAKGGGAI